MLTLPALRACGILSLRLDSDTVVGGDTISGVIQQSPACLVPPLPGVTVLDVTGSTAVLPGVMVGAELGDRPGTVHFRVRSMEVQTPTDVLLTASLTIPLPSSPTPLVLSSARAMVRLLPPLLGELQVPATIASAGLTQLGSVSLTRPAPPGGAAINLTNSRPDLVMVPSTVTVGERATEADFPIAPIGRLQGMLAPRVRITAQQGSTQRQAEFTLLPLLVTELTATPNPVVRGMPVTIMIRFNAPLRESEPIRILVGSQEIRSRLPADGQPGSGSRRSSGGRR